MPAAARVDPFNSRNFRVEIDGIAASAFLEVTGLEAEVAVVDYRNGSDKAAGERKLPGESKFGNLVLKRGFTADLSLWNWMLQTLQGEVSRRNLAVVMLDDTQTEVMRFLVSGAWPVRWSGPLLNAETGEVAIETLEVAHEGLSVSV